MSNHKYSSSLVRRLWKIVIVFGIIAIVGIFGIIGASYLYIRENHQYVYSDSTKLETVLETVPTTAIVLGSGITPDAQPRPVLKSRLDSTINLYNMGLIDKVIVSGYFPYQTYNEPKAMASYLSDNGIAMDDIFEDEQGDNTFATCQNATNKNIKQAIVISQASHLDRTVYLCRSLGVEVYGYSSDTIGSTFSQYLQSIREALSNVKAIYDVHSSNNN